MENQDVGSNVLTRLLHDSIPEKDAFGGHEKVAKAIYELINEEEKGGKAIALSGSYGSGKSSVLEFLKKKFQDNEKKDKIETKIFVFDAWEHQGNPLRRAFIEKYVDFLKKEANWSTQKEWQEEIKKISKQVEEIETKTEPYVTTVGGLLALVVLLLPLGLAIVNIALKNEGTNPLILYIGYFLLLSPIILLLIIYIIRRPWRSEERKKIEKDLYFKKRKFNKLVWFFWRFWICHRPPHHKKSLFSIFVKETKEDVTSTSFKSPDPTTIEFQRIFNNITRKVLNSKNRRLIIAIDNIDRLTTESSINAWTTLRTFLENDNKEWNWKDKFWIIAPFDFQEIKNLWGGLSHLNNSDQNGDSQNTSDYVQAFIDKTFQVTFRVPKPVLSDWKKFFNDQLSIAFPNLKDDEVFNLITTLYQLKAVKKEESPTPRDIKQFINRVGAQYRIWHKEEISLPALAYYELIANVEHEKLVKKLQKGELVNPIFKSLIVDRRLNKKLAAIHFNCEIGKADQVLFGDQVASALQEGNASIVKDFHETDGFLDVLNNEFYVLQERKITQSLANCALCLSKIEEYGEHNFNNYYRQLSTSFNGIDSFKPFNQSIGKGIVTVWEKTGTSEAWIASILKNLSNINLDDEEDTIENWFSLIQPILEELEDKGASHLLKDNLTIPGSAKEFIEVLSHVNQLETNSKEKLATYMQPNAEPNEIVTTYSNLLNSEDLTPDLGGTLYIQSLADEEIGVSEWDWGNLVNQIKTKIQANTNAIPDQIEASLKMMLVLSYKLKKNSAIQLSNDQNFKNGLFFLINNQNDDTLLALSILSSVLFNPNNQKSSNDNNVNRGHNALNNILSNPNDKEFIKKGFFNYLIKYQLVESFFEVQDGNNTLQSLSKSIIQQLFETEKATDFVNTDIVFKHFDAIYDSINKELLLKYIETLYNREENIVNKITANFETIPSKYQLHYYFAKTCPNELRESYFNFLVQGFRGMEKDQWLNHLVNETELIYLAILIQELGLDLKMSVKFKDALDEHYKQLYTGKTDPPSESLISKWNILLGSLDESVKNTFLKKIKYHIESNEDGMVANVGYLYDSILIDEDIYLSDAGRFISTVFIRILKVDDTIELKWLKNLIHKQPEILTQDKSATEAFKQEIKYINIENYSPEFQDLIQKIAKELEVKIQNESNKN